ncbi:ATP-binding protein [Leptolyngbya sp. AN02str]|uniref:GAF domain-containing sensor histidine kinase n=1 Tax=Leptolyngbya sp. AN02str TaxID=3423363 RepID=UPI003D31831F
MTQRSLSHMDVQPSSALRTFSPAQSVSACSTISVLLDAIPIPAAIVRQADGRILHSNSAFVEFSGSGKQVMLHSLLDLCDYPTDRQQLQAALAHAHPQQLQVQLRSLRGGLQAVDLSIQSLEDPGSVLVMIRHMPTPPQPEPAMTTPTPQLPVNLASARPETELEPTAEVVQTQAVNQILQAIHQSLDLGSIFTGATKAIAQMLEADRVTVLQYRLEVEPAANHWRKACIYPPIRDAYAAADLVIIDEQGELVEAMKQANILMAASPHSSHERMHRAFVGNWLLVPLYEAAPKSGDRTGKTTVWGGLVLERDPARSSWQPWEIASVQTVAHQLSVAIHQANLYRQVTLLNAELERQVQARNVQLQAANDMEETLKRITDKVRDSLDEDQILQTAVQELAIALGAHSCNAALYDLGRDTSTIRYEYTTSGCSFQGQITRITNFPHIYDQLLQGLTFQFCSMLPNPVRGRVAMLACPIQDDQGVLGDLWLTTQQFSAFSKEDLRLVQMVASQCAIALRQSRLFQAAQAQVAELERLNRLKDDFLSTISHELRTPMANIKMAIQMLEISLNREGLLDINADSDENAPAIARYFSILNEECSRETKLINDLLDLSRLDAEAKPLTLTTLNLYGWVPHLTESFVRRAREAFLHLQIDLPPQLPTLTTDLTLLERVLTELIDNACKYTPAGGTITLAVREGLRAETSGIEISIINTGVEIPQTELAYVFDKFYRLPSSDPWKHSGTGLGLALVKKLVEHLGGEISVESADSKIEFCVFLPELRRVAPLVNLSLPTDA